MRKLLLLGILFLNGCLYSFEDNCIRPIIQTVSSNCYKNKGEEFPAIAHYQKQSSIGKTDSQQRWKDAVNCGAVYGDSDLEKLHRKNYEKFQRCMEVKGYKKFWPAECGYQNPKWDKGKCNL
ncbi:MULTISPECIES: hypothetical protein [Pasteurellaceae]|uniref:hypothetical protein n=1 Tax=Pasteurellaceae TaxID=712 RepID=UPI0035653ED2